MTVTCAGRSKKANLEVLRAAYPLLARAPTVFDSVILADASASDLDVMVTLPLKGGRCESRMSRILTSLLSSLKCFNVSSHSDSR